MNNGKDKRLDDLFRKNLEDPADHIHYEEEDWDALEQMLDKRKRRRGVIAMLPLLGSVAAALLVFFGLWMLWPKQSPVKNATQVQTAIVQPRVISTNPAKQHAGQITPSKYVAAVPANKTSVPKLNAAGKSPFIAQAASPVKLKDSVSKPDTIFNQQAKAKQVLAANHNKKAAPQQNTAVQPFNLSDLQKAIRDELNAVNKTNVASQNMLAAPVLANRQKSIAGLETPPPAANNLIAGNTLHSPVLRESIAALSVVQTGRPANTLAPKTTTTAPLLTSAQKMDLLLQQTSGVNATASRNSTPASFKSGFSVGVVGAQDINGAGSFQQSKLGGKAGVTVTAAVVGRFTISSGSLYSVTPYTANYSNYHFPYQFKNDPQSISANCTMLDIPLNVGYRLINKRRNSVSIGTGFSSYVMLQQDFTFNYANAPQTKYSMPNNESYLFKIVNFNATYEHQISSRAGVTVQPYLKLPLADVGYSQVKLQTTGVAVGLTWNLSSASK